MDDELKKLLCDVILAARANGQNMKKAAEEAAEAYSAGQAAFKNAVNQTLAKPAPGSPVAP